MRSFLLFLIAVICLAGIVSAQSTDAVPTLTPPTLVPTVPASLAQTTPVESGVARIRDSGTLRVGILFNAPPYGELNLRGEVSGFDADLARSIADAWGVTLEFVQATDQNAIALLRGGFVDLLIARRTHWRELDQVVEFSQTYHVGKQLMMVRADDPAQTLNDMSNRRIGYVLVTDGERALNEWRANSGIVVETQPYVNLDRAYIALAQGEIDGVVARGGRLRRVLTQPELIRFLDEPVLLEPYGIVFRRQDVNMRNLVNRTLQYLVQSGRLFEIHDAHFPGELFPDALYVIWDQIGEEPPKPSQFPVDVPNPVSLVDRLQPGQVVRVAGYTDFPPSSQAAVRVNALSKSLMDRMAEIWGVRVEYLPNSVGTQALDMVASGAADIAVAVEPTWAWADRLDFTLPYIVHGDRLMVPGDSNIETFRGLQRRELGVVDSDATVIERAEDWAKSVEVDLTIVPLREQDLGFAILSQESVDAVFGDSLMLIAHLQRSENLRLTDRWYSREYITFAVPRNDLDFRLQIEYTLQDLVLDGTLESLSSDVLESGELPQFDIWPRSVSFERDAQG